MTPMEDIYKAFLSKMTEDDWTGWTEAEVQADFNTLLDSAIVWFKFPKHSLEYNAEIGFSETLTLREIQIISTYMKCEWLNRTILTWENVKPLYDERDYSPANFLNRLNNLLDREKKKAKELESIYYRAIDRKPFDYTQLAGDNYD